MCAGVPGAGVPSASVRSDGGRGSCVLSIREQLLEHFLILDGVESRGQGFRIKILALGEPLAQQRLLVVSQGVNELLKLSGSRFIVSHSLPKLAVEAIGTE